jgi:hypothetical protein
VRAPKLPLYQLGWLGDDGDDSDDDQVPLLTSPLPDSIALPTISAPLPTITDPYANPGGAFVNDNGTSDYGPEPANSGGGTPGYPSSSGSSSLATSIASAISSVFSPSPRVSSTPTAAAAPGTISMGSAVPLLAMAAVAIVLVSSAGGSRRRR